MNWRFRFFVLILTALALTVSACSKENVQEKKQVEAKSSVQQASEVIEAYTKKPVEKAKKTQTLGEDRTKGIDEALEKMDKR
jgi:hypothetical protein